MPRNSSGTMTLPAGNPVTSGTTISSSTHNSTMGDLATELTDSLSRSGKGGMTAPLRTTDGTVNAPSHSFTSDTDTGAYLAAAGDLRLTVAGVDRLKLPAGSAELKGATADGAAAVGVVLDNTIALANAGAKLASVRNAGTEKAYVGPKGNAKFGADAAALPTYGVEGSGTSAGGWFAGDAGGTGVIGLGHEAGPGVYGEGGATGPGVQAYGNAARGAVQMIPQSDPSAPSEGDIWIASASDSLRLRINATTRTIPALGVSADRGDTNQTLAVAVDLPIQRWATTLTANRTVTLSTTGAVAGQWFRVVRTGLGAFTLNVGGLKTIPSATAAFVDVMYDGTAWVLTGYGPL